MSIFDENINIEYLESLGFKPCIRNISTGKISQMVLHMRCQQRYGCSASIYYMFNKTDENVLVDFRGTYSSTKYFETITDRIEIGTLILNIKEMILEDVDNCYLITKYNRPVDIEIL